MRPNPKLQRSLAVLLTVLLLCMSLVLPGQISPVQAAEANLADQAVAFITDQYNADGAQNDPTMHYPFAAYLLHSAELDTSEWAHDDVSMRDAVCALVDADLANENAAAKYLAQDLLLMLAWEESSRTSQLQTLLQNRQQADGSFANDNSPYSVIAAYDLLGRANQLSSLDTAAAKAYILDQQDTESGAWPETWTDFMTTAEAVRALAYLEPDYSDESQAGAAISQGINWLRQQQQEDGSFQTTWDDPLIDTVEAIATQKALGLSPASDWTTNGRSAVEYFQNSAVNADGSFGSGQNLMDAAWALDGCILLGILPTGSGGGGEDPSESVTVRVRVEGASSCLADTTVTVSGTALDALCQAVGNANVTAPGGFVSSICGESGVAGVDLDTDSSWFYYVIRNNAVDPASLSSAASGYQIANGDQIIFYIGAYGHTTYAPKTFLPAVSLSPPSPRAGQTLTISISAMKYDWNTGLQDLTVEEAAAIGNYTITAKGIEYTSQSGLAAIPNLKSGTLDFAVTNQNSAGYPNVVPYRGSITISGSSGGSLGCMPGVAVVGLNGQILFGPAYVDLSETNEWGLTALGTLDATGLSYTISSKWEGFVESIEGLQNTDQQGWMYTVNNTTPMVLAKDYDITDGDKVIWYYSQSMTQSPPTWEDLVSGQTGEVYEPANSKTGSGLVYPSGGGTIGLGSEASVSIPAGALQGSSPVTVAIRKVDNPPTAAWRLLGPVFALTVGGSSSYQFLKPVTLTFYFDSEPLSPDEKPAVCYYDEDKSEWVKLEGLVSGNSITVTVDHFTNFTVMAIQTAGSETSPPKQVFTDLAASHWAAEAIRTLQQRDLISGYPDGSFQPDKSISRAEVISILNKVLQLPDADASPSAFNDVTPRDWFYGAVKNAVAASVVKGYGSSFKPNEPVSRQELAVMLVNALGKTAEARTWQTAHSSFSDDASIPEWSRGFIQLAVQKGLLKGYPDNSFHPQGSATRAETCMMIRNFLTVYNEAAR